MLGVLRRSMETNELHNSIAKTILHMVEFMNLPCQAQVREEPRDGGTGILVSLYIPENVRFLIGKNGETLRALEHVARLVCLRQLPEGCVLTLDVNDYRKSRAQEVVKVAKLAVARVRNTQKAEALDPMSSYERRIIHTELAACPDIATESIGEGTQRRVVIKPFP